jgi:hypothetical protein
MGMTTHITKTWFDGEKVVTQDIPEADFYRPSMTKDEALKLALEALKTIDEAMPFPVAKLAQAAIKEALAQPPAEQPLQPDYRLVPLVPTDAMQVFVHKQAWINAVNAAPLPVQPEQERYFCQRCGKRRGGDVNYIHTCTPPRGNA